MTAEIRVFVKQIPDAVQIPVHAVYERRGVTLVLNNSLKINGNSGSEDWCNE